MNSVNICARNMVKQSSKLIKMRFASKLSHQLRTQPTLSSLTDLGKNLFLPPRPFSYRGLTVSSSASSEKDNDFGATETAGVDGKKQEKDSDDQGAAKLAELEAKFSTEKKKLCEQVELFTDKYKRALAETENTRNRLNKQINEVKLYGIQSFCKDLLEVADVLNKAIESVPEEKLKTEDEYFISMFSGLEMTEKQLQKIFRRNGLNKIDPQLGEKFDPNFHEALFELPAKDGKPGTVAAVTKIGYSLHERTLRPALVGVAAAADK